MKYFCVSDVHSFFKELMTALDKAGFERNNPDHILCVLGDLFDRGEGSVELFDFIKQLQEEKRLIYILGNHEDLLHDCVKEIKKGIFPDAHHFSNGTIGTIKQFCGNMAFDMLCYKKEICKTMQPILDFIDNNAVDYAEIGDFVLVHGWIPCNKGAENFRECSNEQWKIARWENGMARSLSSFYKLKDKTIICGHYHCSWGWSHIRRDYKEFPSKNIKNWKESFKPFIDDGIIAIDACTAYSGICNCVVLEVD